MKVKVFTLNDNGKIEFTENELKELLDEIYNTGYYEATHKGYIYYTPWKYPQYPYYTTTATSSGINISSSSTAGTIKYETPTTTASCSDCKGCDK